MAWLAKPAIVRFGAKYEAVPETGCWLWTAAVDGKGYGAFRMGKMEQAHRASWLLHCGPIPEGMCVCHKCDTPTCVNPDHLFLGTVLDNNADRDAKGRTRGARGEHNEASKLTESDVRAIRLALGTQTEIAASFGVDKRRIGLIRRHQAWRHVA